GTKLSQIGSGIVELWPPWIGVGLAAADQLRREKWHKSLKSWVSSLPCSPRRSFPAARATNRSLRNKRSSRKRPKRLRRLRRLPPFLWRASPPPATEPLHSAGKPDARPADTKALLAPKKLLEKAPDTYKVKFDTTRGAFTITVTRAWAPLGADRFYNLVKHHFYDNAAFFRVVPGFVVQFGISPTPRVSAAGKHTETMAVPVTQTNKRVAFPFATAGPNTRPTRVFIS